MSIYYKKMSIIAICGGKTQGKDTFANYLVQKYNYKNIKIAQQLKDVIKFIFNFNDDQVNGSSKDIIDEKWKVKPRDLMQYIGTDIMQFNIQSIIPNIGRKLWIKNFIENNINNNVDKRLVISDLRFLHEYEELKNYNNNIIFIRIERDTIKSNDNHISEIEHEVIPVNYIIKNNDSIEELHKNIDILFKMNSSIFNI